MKQKQNLWCVELSPISDCLQFGRASNIGLSFTCVCLSLFLGHFWSTRLLAWYFRHLDLCDTTSHFRPPTRALPYSVFRRLSAPAKQKLQQICISGHVKLISAQQYNEWGGSGNDGREQNRKTPKAAWCIMDCLAAFKKDSLESGIVICIPIHRVLACRAYSEFPSFQWPFADPERNISVPDAVNLDSNWQQHQSFQSWAINEKPRGGGTAFSALGLIT